MLESQPASRKPATKPQKTKTKNAQAPAKKPEDMTPEELEVHIAARKAAAKAKWDKLRALRESPTYSHLLFTPSGRLDALVADLLARLFPDHARINTSTRAALRSLLENFIAHGSRCDVYLAVALSAKDSFLRDLPGRYNPAGVTADSLSRVVKALHEAKLVHLATGCRAGNRGFLSRVAPKKELRKMLLGVGLKPSEIAVHPEAELVELKSSKYRPAKKKLKNGKEKDVLEKVRKKYIDYMENKETRAMRQFLRTYNRFLSSGRIRKSGSRLEITLKRVFNESSFRKGGRFYGSHQNFPSMYRSRITIGGEDVVELDYKGMHIHMLYIWAGQGLYTAGDVYTVPGYEKHRSLFKKVLQTMLNAHSAEMARKGAQNNINKDPSARADKLNARDVLEAFARKHEPIRRYFQSCVGLDLQRADSDIAERVMRKALAAGVPVLPVHDSFVGPASRKEDLVKWMREASLEVLGVELLIDDKTDELKAKYAAHREEQARLRAEKAARKSEKLANETAEEREARLAAEAKKAAKKAEKAAKRVVDLASASDEKCDRIDKAAREFLAEDEELRAG